MSPILKGEGKYHQMIIKKPSPPLMFSEQSPNICFTKANTLIYWSAGLYTTKDRLDLEVLMATTCGLDGGRGKYIICNYMEALDSYFYRFSDSTGVVEDKCSDWMVGQDCLK